MTPWVLGADHTVAFFLYPQVSSNYGVALGPFPWLQFYSLRVLPFDSIILQLVLLKVAVITTYFSVEAWVGLDATSSIMVR